MNKPKKYIFEDWDSMCAKAHKELQSDFCIENEVLVEMHKYVAALDNRVAELKQVADNQILPPLGLGFSGDYIIGYAEACADISKQLKESDE